MSKNNNFLQSERVLNFRYKLSKLLSYLPSKSRNTLSLYENINLRSRFYDQLWRDSAESLNYTFEDLGYGYWKISDKAGRYVRGNSTSIEIDTSISLVISGNKPLVHKLVGNTKGYHVANYCEFDLHSSNLAKKFLKTAKGPCVVKPAQDTGAGSGVTMNICTEDALINASIQASIWSKQLMIEETIAGNSYRILVLNNQVLSTIRRDPPQVIGDGKKTIKELIDIENNRRMTSPKILSLFPILIDMECKNTLKSQSYSLSSVPDVGKVVPVKIVVNQNAAEQNIDVSELVHPEIIQTAIEASKKVGLNLAGVDVLTSDISRPLSETKGVINEVNGSPGLHHHYLVSKPQQTKITETILEYCMSKSNQG